MGWNHRILAHEHNGEVYLQIHEVYYNEEGKPNGYTENPISVGSETVKGITWTLNKMLECRTKPILWAGEKFPNECKTNGCGEKCYKRDTLDSKNQVTITRCKDSYSKEDLDEHFGLVGNLLIFLVLLTLTIVIFCINIDIIVAGFINPEYGAIKDIINFVSNTSKTCSTCN